jgi:hypothetical protein
MSVLASYFYFTNSLLTAHLQCCGAVEDLYNQNHHHHHDKDDNRKGNNHPPSLSSALESPQEDGKREYYVLIQNATPHFKMILTSDFFN